MYPPLSPLFLCYPLHSLLVTRHSPLLCIYLSFPAFTSQDVSLFDFSHISTIMSKVIAVAGGSGGIGQHIVDGLLSSKKFKVVVLSRKVCPSSSSSPLFFSFLLLSSFTCGCVHPPLSSLLLSFSSPHSKSYNRSNQNSQRKG